MRARGSSKTLIASSKLTKCFARFAAALSSSQSKPTGFIEANLSRARGAVVELVVLFVSREDAKIAKATLRIRVFASSREHFENETLRSWLQDFHLQTGEDERPYCFRIVVADSFGHVVLVGSVAIAFFFGVAAEADDGDGFGDVDQAGRIDFDELLENAVVGTACSDAVPFVDVPESRGLEQDEGEHRRR